jgi:hypothetical protein
MLLAGCATMSPAPKEEAPPAKVVAAPTEKPAATAAKAPTASTPAAKPPVAAAPSAKASPAAAPTAKAPAPTVAAAKPAAPPTLDLKSLEQQLKDTKAIGVMTKLSIKNQVDDLLEQFRGFYQGKVKTSLADLRRSYDLLVMKVLTLLQDGDQALARAVAGSREAIWGILADPKKFAAI